MAIEPFSTTRRTLLGAAAALPAVALCEGGCPLTLPADSSVEASAKAQALRERVWNRRLTIYRRLAARTKEAAETGFYRQALDRYDREQAALASRFGSWEAARESQEGGPLCRAAFERVDAAEEAYYDRCTAPMHRAAVRLALTPAPDLEALLAKIRIVAEQQLDELGSMTRPVLEVLAEDVAGLATPPQLIDAYPRK
jgi:hypothetical protein